MSKRKISDLDASLAHLSALMLMQYGGTIISAKSEEEKRQAFTSLIMSGVELIAAAICSRRPHDEAMRITVEQFPKVLNDVVKSHLKMRGIVESVIERDGATVQ